MSRKARIVNIVVAFALFFILIPIQNASALTLNTPQGSVRGSVSETITISFYSIGSIGKCVYSAYSSNPGVAYADFDSSGLYAIITLVAPGTATITFSVDDESGAHAETTVTVTVEGGGSDDTGSAGDTGNGNVDGNGDSNTDGSGNKTPEFSFVTGISAKSYVAGKDSSDTLIVTTSLSAIASVSYTFTSSNTSVVSVSGGTAGICSLNILGPGSAIVTVTASAAGYSDISAAINVTVTGEEWHFTDGITSKDYILGTDTTDRFTVKTSLTSEKTVSYKFWSDDTSIVRVSGGDGGDCVLDVISAGSTRIGVTASSPGYTELTKYINVTVAAKSAAATIEVTDGSGASLLSFDTGNISLSSGTYALNVPQSDAYNAAFNLQVLRGCEEVRKGGKFVLTAPDVTFDIAFNIAEIISGLSTRIAYGAYSDYELRLSVSKLTGESLNAARQRLNASLPGAEELSGFYSIDLKLYTTGGTPVPMSTETGAFFTKHVKFSLSAYGSGSTGLIFNSDGTFSPVPVVRSGSSAIFSTMTCSTFVLIRYAPSFGDIAGHWSQSYVEEAASRYLVQGMGDGSYDPDSPVTRAQFATMIVRSVGLTAYSAERYYSDVSPGDWYYSYVGAAKNMGLLGFVNSPEFMPDKPLTREEMAFMLFNALRLGGDSTVLSYTEISSVLNAYTDSLEISQEYREAVAVCTQKGLLLGSDGKFEPSSSLTRGQSATVLMRMLKDLSLI